MTEDDAWTRYRRLVLFMGVVALAGIIAALAYLHLTGTKLHLQAVIALSLGIGGAVLLAGVLMALVFASNASGHDDAVRDETGDDWE